MSHSIKRYYQDNFEVIELKNEFISAKVAVNIGNTLFSFQEKKEILYFPFSLEEYKQNAKLAGVPFLHPFANRLEGGYIHIENTKYGFPKEQTHLLYRDGNNLPMHGLLLKSDQWKTIELFENENSSYHVAEFIFNDEDVLSIFPFNHRIQIKHQLQNNELKIETTVINEDEKEMPVSFGFHPYFFKNNSTPTLSIPAGNVIEVDKVMIPTGKIFPKENKWNFTEDTVLLDTISFDDGFRDLKLDSRNQAVFSMDSVRVEFDEHYPFAQIYAPMHPEKPYVCIEPMTAPTNALNTSSCKKIKQGEKFTASFSIVL